MKAVDAAGNLECRLGAVHRHLGLDAAADADQPHGAVADLGGARSLSWQSGGGGSRLRPLRRVPQLDAHLVGHRDDLHRRSAGTAGDEREPELHRQGGRRARQRVDRVRRPHGRLRHHRAPSAVAIADRRLADVHPSLGWTTATDTGGSGLAGYRVYRDGVAGRRRRPARRSSTPRSRSTAPTPTPCARSTTPATSAPPSPTRTVQVDQTPPPAPTGLFAQSPTNHVTLSWPATSDTGASGSGVAQYRVYRNGSADLDRLGDRVHRYLARDRGHVAVHRLGDRRDRQRGAAERADLGPVRRHSATRARRARRRADLDDPAVALLDLGRARTRSRASTTSSCCATARSSPRPRRRASST